jgi:hypothetical protein
MDKYKNLTQMTELEFSDKLFPDLVPIDANPEPNHLFTAWA